MRQHSSELTRLTSGYLHRPLDMAVQPVFSSHFSILSPRNHKNSSNTRKSSIPSDLLPNCQSRSIEQDVSMTQPVLMPPCCPNDHCSLSLCDSSTVHLPGPMLLSKTASAPEVPLGKPGISVHSPQHLSFLLQQDSSKTDSSLGFSSPAGVSQRFSSTEMKGTSQLFTHLRLLLLPARVPTTLHFLKIRS